MRIGSLFAGIGGFDLAARWMGWETAWYSEIEPYACAVMQQHFSQAVNHGDITKIDGRAVEQVDLLCGGFPCQDISFAGKGAGIDGERSGLWAHYARLIGEIRPRWVVAENVSALRSRGFDRVLKDLMALGYDAEWHCIPASYVGAPHRRDRIWIIAYPNANVTRLEGRLGEGLRECAGQQSVGPLGSPLADAERLSGATGGAARYVARTSRAPEGEGVQRERSGDAADDRGAVVSHLGADRRESWWESEPDVGRVAHGVPSRVDRLRCLGNAVVPQIPLLLFQAIEQVEHNRQVGEIS